jgi:hypothetical protein
MLFVKSDLFTGKTMDFSKFVFGFEPTLDVLLNPLYHGRSMVPPPLPLLLPLRQCRSCCHVKQKWLPILSHLHNKFLSTFGRNGTMKSFLRVFQFSLTFCIQVNYTQLNYAKLFRNTFNLFLVKLCRKFSRCHFAIWRGKFFRQGEILHYQNFLIHFTSSSMWSRCRKLKILYKNTYIQI